MLELGSNTVIKFVNPTQSNNLSIEPLPPIDVKANTKPNAIGIIEINANTNIAGDKMIYSKPLSQTDLKYDFVSSISFSFLRCSDTLYVSSADHIPKIKKNRDKMTIIKPSSNSNVEI